MQHPRAISSLSVAEALKALRSSPDGLNERDANVRRHEAGDNTLPRSPIPGPVGRFFRQFRSPLIAILLVVAAIMPLLGTVKDAFVILIVLLFNATIGTIQEGRASRALAALESATVPMSRVRRDGHDASVPTDAIVPGDIVLLEEGDVVPADGRLIEANGLRVDESMLTGESVPVGKTSEPIVSKETTPLGDLRNAGFRQTHVVAGRGRLLVTATGVSTEVGQIAVAIRSHETEPPLAGKIKTLGRAITISVFLFSLALFGLGLAIGRPAPLLLATVLTLAVSIIPEGLPVVLTLVLARGVSRMAARRAIVRRLQAVEGLGQVHVICTDKTGTLTTNILDVRDASATGQTDAMLLQAAAAFGGLTSDPIDSALAHFASTKGIARDNWTKLDERPFSYDEQRRYTTYRMPDGRVMSFVAGSPERVFASCHADDGRSDAEEALKRFAVKGLRVIAFATREGEHPFENASPPWRCIGCVGLGDSLRPEAAHSVAWCRDQGIRVVMVTGDHPDTALSIAREAGIAQRTTEVLHGNEFDALTDEAFRSRIESVRVFARISPAHKLRIVNAYRAKGLITAMTGDGVNDAPALHAADIGVAMGKTGTDVAREASDLVLLDDNFATIVAAVQEGRAVIGNVRKVVTYLFSTSIAEALVIAVTLLGNLPIPLLPAQIIWLNLVTDGFLDVSLAMEPTHYSKRKTPGALIDARSISRILLLGSVMAGGAFLVYASALNRPIEELRSLTLLTLAIFQWMNAWNARSETTSVFRISPVSNPYLIAATGTIILLQLAAIYTPSLQSLLGTVPLNFNDWLLAIGMSTLVIGADEIWKRARR